MHPQIRKHKRNYRYQYRKNQNPRHRKNLCPTDEIQSQIDDSCNEQPMDKIKGGHICTDPVSCCNRLLWQMLSDKVINPVHSDCSHQTD